MRALYGVALGTVSKSYQQMRGLKAQVVEFALRVGSMSLSAKFQKLVIVLIACWALFSASALILAFWPASLALPRVWANKVPVLSSATRRITEVFMGCSFEDVELVVRLRPWSEV